MNEDEIPKDWWTSNPKWVRQARDLARVRIANKAIDELGAKLAAPVFAFLDAAIRRFTKKESN